MARIIIIIYAMSAFVMASAETFSYRFHSTPLPKAIQRLMDDHQDLDINFIYNELENYTTSANVDADNAYDAIRQVVGFNPVIVVKSKNAYYLEALQHGRYIYTGRAVGTDRVPIAAATVMLLNPKDSAVLTYGIADAEGRFRIPCDRRNVIAKLSCLGYETTYHHCNSFSVGTIVMPERAVKLGTVTIEAENMHLYADRSIYIPTLRQKNAAQDAVDLLRQMAIPQIRINPINGRVTDNSGMDVAIFINYMKASNGEKEGLRTADVKRIEYLESPNDPRFRGAERVINFIVQEYEYGGYTKVTANENFLIGLSSRGSVFSKFTYKKMTYDLYAGANNWSSRHIGKSTVGTYRLIDNDGDETLLNRTETQKSSKFAQNQYPITLQATYRDKKAQIRNLVAFTNLSIPKNEYEGSLEYSPYSANSYTFNRKNPSRSNSMSYAGSYFIILPKDFTIDFSPSFNYTHTNDYMNYLTSDNPDIYRHAMEDAFDYRLSLYVMKKLNKRHAIMFGSVGGDNINRLNYVETKGYRDKFHIAYAAGVIAYKYATKDFSFNIDGGYSWEGSSINGQKKNDTYPFTHINARYSLNQKNIFALYFQYATDSPGLSAKSPDVLKENELMYISGNPSLKNSRHTMLNLEYTSMPSSRLGMSFYGHFSKFYNRLLLTYEPYLEKGAILRTYVNNGDYFNGEIGFAVNWKLCGGNLQLYANPRQKVYKSTGIYNRSYNPFSILLQASYYVGSLYFQANYESPDKSMYAQAPQINNGRNFHSLTMGWANQNWNLRIMAANFLNKGWNSAVNITESPYYTERQRIIGTTSHPRINFSVTYTFGYGKKIQQDNEVGEQSGAASAILK